MSGHCEKCGHDICICDELADKFHHGPGCECYDCLKQRLAEARGAMEADDRRLRVAAQRVGLLFGCDAPERMADEIERLRTALLDATNNLWDDSTIKLVQELEAARAAGGV